jgi:hypothetical protein
MVIVNGYICMNCCDIDKARLGQDPHQSTNQIQKQLERHLDKLSPANFGPAVTLGGSLQGTATGTATGDAADSISPAPTPQNANGLIAPSRVDLVV